MKAPFLLERAVNKVRVDWERVLPVVGIIGGALLFSLFLTQIITVSITTDDKKCIAAYGENWEHTSVGEGEETHAVCQEQETKEQKPVPEEKKDERKT